MNLLHPEMSFPGLMRNRIRLTTSLKQRNKCLQNLSAELQYLRGHFEWIYF